MSSAQTPRRTSVFALFITAIGVVFGDIGTSPLYTIKETFGGHHPLPIDRLHVMGVLSLIFWALTLIVAIKYVIVIMRADNNGEGGSLALLALLSRAEEPELTPGAGRGIARPRGGGAVLRRQRDHARYLGPVGGRRPSGGGARVRVRGHSADHRDPGRCCSPSSAPARRWWAPCSGR